ncbi:PQQ-binding-like beta-propeller repeat protein [Prosthecobacter sp.]|uniref:PQQ-binding-like beta-propeller repeat protein n=1 Tax=Prosthecobacter sp. TaxID=1965333 RepID=UPI002ABA12DE|nr:PQQ-binding-like beta-propeller repeat protein [Prosthecobacter sp.]MDZ4401719.1 PQQ-binding-like beta-propeller repeat protein [Prosthecobacter sp.]
MQRVIPTLRATCLVIAIITTLMANADDWPQFRGMNRDAVWNETGIMQTFPPEGLAVRWRAAAGGGFSSPVVAQGRVYLADSALQKPKAQERVRCWDEKTGQILWTHLYDVSYPDNAFNPPQGPGSTPIVEAGKLFALGITGHLHCLDAVKGEVLWKRNLTADYGLAEFSGTTPSPLIEGDLIILVIGGKPSACVVALDKNTGNEVWRALDDKWTYSSPIVISAGGQRQLIVWTPDAVTSLNPVNGKTWWREELNTPGTLATVPTPVLKGDLLLFSGLMFQLDPAKPAASALWPESKNGTKRILSQTSIPLILGDHVFSGKMPGKLVCLEARTGNQVWETDKVTVKSSGSIIHLTPNGHSVLIFTDEGNLIRARLTPKGYEELSRVHVINPTCAFGGRKVVWPPPAYANQHIFARNEEELICASLAAKP